MPKCPACGTAVTDIAQYCSECGTSLDDIGETQVAGSDVDLEREADRSSNTSRESMFYIGAVLGVFGVVVFPYVFFLVALPEAILHLVRGHGTLEYLSRDARDNPAMKGTFLIFRWYGNFLILAFFAGILIGFLLLI
ncbi:zinc-ribbon domain-containing protein [Halopenitus salinus]|uniref:Zinc-ribbon domain-containing protein n=1 Tax=Halopenitus salinus TaxID=1198295 RepID=A0ABD5UYF6_9EURY